MAIKIKVGQPEEGMIEPADEQEKPVQASMFINARKALNGDIMIFDHNDVDVVIIPENKKLFFKSRDSFTLSLCKFKPTLFVSLFILLTLK